MSCTTSIEKNGTFEVSIKRSRFIGNCRRCTSEEDAKSFIRDVSAAFANAQHNCWAFRVSNGSRETTNFSDAGEPHGSAGAPIIGAIEKLGLTNVAVVVTRYFGGTKLGIRGLIDAYGGTALQCLKVGSIAKFCVGFEILLEMSYSQWSDMTHLLNPGVDYTIEGVAYTDLVKARVLVMESSFSRLAGFLEERRIQYSKGKQIELSHPVEQ
jgi:uncharacterized YigZ family protein